MIAETEAIDSTGYTMQYELLRAQVFGTANDRGPRRGIGLAVLLREGMPRLFFAIFKGTGSCLAVVKEFQARRSPPSASTT